MPTSLPSLQALALPARRAQGPAFALPAPFARLLGPAGLPVGQICAFAGAAGKTGALRGLVGALQDQGVAVAWVDGPRALCPADWCRAAAAPLWVVRPPRLEDAAWCAEVLLRTGAFGLVVLEAPPDARQGVRLQRVAREVEARLVWIGAVAATLPGIRRLVFRAAPPTVEAPGLPGRGPLAWPVTVEAQRGGPPAEGALVLREAPPERLTAHGSAVDRGARGGS